MIGAQVQNAPEPMWWLDMSGKMHGWIANEVAMMSMETNVGLTFMDIALMLKINELEEIYLGQ